MDNPFPCKVAIMFGGQYAEHDISIFSFINLYRGLQSDQPSQQIRLSGIYYLMRDGRVLLSKADLARPARDYMDMSQAEVLSLPGAFSRMKDRDEFMYLVCDGALGVDGRFSGLAQAMGIAGTFGSNLGFSLSRSKFHMNQFVGTNYQDIHIPLTLYIHDLDELNKAFETFEGRRIVVKPASLGSSIHTDVFVCTPDRHADITGLAGSILELDTRAMIQEYISGREIGCYCMEKNSKVDILGLREFKKPAYSLILGTKDKYLSLHKEGDNGFLKSDIPAVSRFAERLFRDADCRNLARMDFIISDEGRIFFLENNINPALRGMIEAYRNKYSYVTVYDMLKLLVENETARVPVNTEFYLDINRL